jgi:hypothetical protein
MQVIGDRSIAGQWFMEHGALLKDIEGRPEWSLKSNVVSPAPQAMRSNVALEAAARGNRQCAFSGR